MKRSQKSVPTGLIRSSMGLECYIRFLPRLLWFERVSHSGPAGQILHQRLEAVHGKTIGSFMRELLALRGGRGLCRQNWIPMLALLAPLFILEQLRRPSSAQVPFHVVS